MVLSNEDRTRPRIEQWSERTLTDHRYGDGSAEGSAEENAEGSAEGSALVAHARSRAWRNASAIALFLLALAATWTISIRSPLPSRVYECGIFLLGGRWASRELLRTSPLRVSAAGLALALIAVWGFAELALGMTVYRNATWDGSLRMAAMASTAYVGSRTLACSRLRAVFFDAFAWAGFLVSILAVLTYYTSPRKILWMFASPYPDTWGPFLSRNDLCAFFELSLPVSLWLALHGDRARASLYTVMSASMFAAGIASASRAGAALLTLEIALIGANRARPTRSLGAARKPLLQFAAMAVLCAAVAEPGMLLRRLSEPDPMKYRREIAGSALRMIGEKPWEGFGLGTFATVYPAYATFDSGALVEHAHNDWLEWASEGGLAFAAAWLALAVVIAPTAIRSVWGTGVVGIFLHAIVDYPFSRFGITAWCFILIGALLTTSGASRLREVRVQDH